MLRGKSGSGKSDLALRAMTSPLQLPEELNPCLFELVSDDQTVVARHGTRLHVSAPDTIKNLLEVRGIGIVSVSSKDGLPLCLVADLAQAPIERLPTEADITTSLAGVVIDTIKLNPWEPSAPAKLALALKRAASKWKEN